MIGTVTAMEPAAFQAWLSGGSGGGTMVENGAKLFTDLSCNTCHLDTGQGRGPVLKGLYGKQVLLHERPDRRRWTTPTFASRS